MAADAGAQPVDSACESPRDGRPGYESWLLKFLRPRLIRLICIRTPDVLDVDRDPDSADLDVLRASIGESLAFGLAGLGRAPGYLAPTIAGLPREFPGPAAGPAQTVPGAG